VWRDDSALSIVRGDAFGNKERAELFEYRRNVEKLGRPVDRGEWVMVPQVVDAVNLPVRNAMNFPAGILQPPYFDPRASAQIRDPSLRSYAGSTGVLPPLKATFAWRRRSIISPSQRRRSRTP
jgi:hypothetical protein